MFTRTWLRWLCLILIIIGILTPSNAVAAQDGPAARILIIDDFFVPPAPPVVDTGSEFAQLQIVNPNLVLGPAYAEINLAALQLDLCAVNPEILSGQGKLGMHRSMGPTVPNYSHGQIVEQILRQTLSEMGILRHISIETVDIAEANAPTDDGIAELIQRYADRDRSRPLIVNMSFAFVPCNLLRDPEFVQPATMEAESLMDWRADIATSALQQIIDPLPELINPDFTHIDPSLFQLSAPLTRLAEQYPNVIMVASAGNFDEPYPLLPAGYPGVVSVGSLDPQQHFNDGEVAADSYWNMDQFSGEGTSFAAPRVTAQIAQYLREHPARCNSGSIPYNFQDGTQVQWRNVAIGATTACPDDRVIIGEASGAAQPGTFGFVTLEAGFLPDPYTINITSGGARDAAQEGCVGFIADRHDFLLDWSGRSGRIRIFFNSGGDTTLLVIGPNGERFCNDDTNGLNPMVEIRNPAQGSYRIWVGSFSPGEYLGGTLSITERDLIP